MTDRGASLEAREERRAHVRRLTRLLELNDGLPDAVAAQALLDQMEAYVRRSGDVIASVDVALLRAVVVARLAEDRGDHRSASACSSLVEALLRISRLMSLSESALHDP